MRKRILASLLSFVMVLSMIPTALAAGDAGGNLLNNSTQIPLGKFTFQTDEQPGPDSDAIQAEAVADSSADSVSAGNTDGMFNDRINVGENSYVFDGITVGGVDVVYIGTVDIDGQTSYCYTTGEDPVNTAVYSLLGAGETFTVNYLRADHYTIDYEIQPSAGQGDNQFGGYSLDDVFGSNRTTDLDVSSSPSADEDSYIVNVTIPRGYKATVSVYDLDDSGQIRGNAVEPLELGRMMEYMGPAEGNNTNGGVVNLVEDSPESIALSGRIVVDDVTSDQKVVLEYTAYEEFTFSAETWITTPNAGNGDGTDRDTGRIEDISLTVGAQQQESGVSATFDPGETVTWRFVGITDSGSFTYLLNYIQINGEYLNIPFLEEHAEEAATAETTLSTGTVVEVTAENFNPVKSWGSADKETQYTITIRNCYEDITISAGNMIAHSHSEVVVESLTGVSGLKLLYTNGDWWDADRGGLQAGNRVAAGTSNVSIMVFQFKHGAGYFLPAVTVRDRNGDEIQGAIQYLRLADGKTVDDIIPGNLDGVFEEVKYDSIVQAADELYFFRFSAVITDKWTGSKFTNSDYNQLHLYLDAQPMRFAVHYDAGEAYSNVANLPVTDDNGGEGYTVTEDNLVSISSQLPIDTPGQHVFAGWEIVAVDGGAIDDGNGNTRILPAGTVLNLSEVLHDWLHEGINHPSDHEDPACFTLRATWNEVVPSETITYSVNYVLDGTLIKIAGFLTKPDASLVFNAYENGALSDALQAILKEVNDNRRDYTIAP